MDYDILILPFCVVQANFKALPAFLTVFAHNEAHSLQRNIPNFLFFRTLS